MANKRIYYAVYQMGVAKIGENSFTSIHGLQSAGMNTNFTLEDISEVGQLETYEQVEGIPSIEITLEKVLDGYPLIYHLATNGSAAATLGGRSTAKCIVGGSIYSDQHDSASGTPLSQVTCSGMYVQSLNYNLQVQGSATESVTLVGNNQVWNNTFTPTAFNNSDEPLAIAGSSGGVQQREDVLFGATDTTDVTNSLLPTEIPGITSSGTNEKDVNGDFPAHVQRIQMSTNLGREELFELGRRGQYHRVVSFPVEVTCEIEILDIEGHKIAALEDSEANLSNQRIYVMMREGSVFDLGSKNKLSSVNWGGANAGQNGGNASVTFSYTNQNSFTVTHPEDPSGL